MNLKADLDVAATLECDAELLPWLPKLLLDFDALGSEPDAVVSLLADHTRSDIRTALDLCCGKGATAVALAGRLGIRVHGVDAMQGFVKAARAAAEAAGVGDRCTFTTGDICEVVTRPADYDLVVFSAVGPILGGITRTIGYLMTPLRPGGWLLIEDSVLRPGAPPRAGFENHAGFAQTRARIELAEAEIVAVRHRAVNFEAGHAEDHPKLERRATELIERRPELARAVQRYLQRQWEEVRYLQRWTEDVTWLLRKAG